MKTRAVILAGGEGSRLGILTAKRAKPAVPFAGKYRIIDFVLSNCCNSGLYDVILLAQYRPQSLIEHIGAGGPWEMNREFSGGVRIYTPYKARFGTDWFVGTADAVQQNFTFVKQGNPDYVLVLSGDHIYAMDYDPLITFHRDHRADVTIATIRVPASEASRFGILDVSDDYRVTEFWEKPANPPSNLANMGVYVFNLKTLDKALWQDHYNPRSAHDFGRDILPALVSDPNVRVFAYPYSGYWVDVGTVDTYWQAHMHLLDDKPLLDLNDRRWVIHTRTEERPPARVQRGAVVEDSLLSGGVVLQPGAVVRRSVLSPGVVVQSGAVVEESIIFTDSIVRSGAQILRSILDKRVQVGENCQVGKRPSLELAQSISPASFVLVGKNSIVPPGQVVLPGAVIANDVIESDFDAPVVQPGETIVTKRQPYEI